MSTFEEKLQLAADIATECSSPIRLLILRLLLEEGQSRVRIMAEQLGVAESTLSNHLKRLRQKGIISVERSGRAATYFISDSKVGDVVAALLSAVGLAPEYPVIDPGSALARARSCYDHLAGEVGVQLTRGLIRSGAIVVNGDNVRIGSNAEQCFASLGVGLTGVEANKRQSFLCDDWSHGDKHLAGALGAALLQGLISRKWVIPVIGSRELKVTEAGKAGIEKFLNCHLK